MKLLKLVILSIFLMIGGTRAMAQIEGYIYIFENDVKVAAAAADVYWEGTEIGTTTNAQGYFSIPTTPSSKQLSASFIGFVKQTKMIISRKGETSFILVPEATELEGVTITGRAEATQIDANSAGLKFDINSKELRKAACCNLSESFETNASIDVSFTDAVTGTKQIEMLGLAGKYALIQRENIPFARGLNALNGLTFIPGPFIQSIQVTKGLSSVINGYESITGQINVEYFKPENAPQLMLNVFASAGGRSELNVLVPTRLSERASMANFIHLSTTPFGQDRNKDGFADLSTGQQLNLSHRTHYRVGDNWEGQLGLNIVNDERKGGQMSFLENDEAGGWGYSNNEERYEFFGKNGYIFPNETLRNIGIIYSASYHNRSTSYGQRSINAEQQNFYLNTILHDFIGNTSHQFKTGISFFAESFTESLSGQSIASSGVYSQDRTEIVPGAYFEYSYMPSDKLSLVLGLRGDYNSLFEKTFVSPRIQMRYDILENSTLRFSGGRGQRSPNRLSENSNALASNRVLRFSDLNYLPEVAWNAGFSWNQNLIFGETLIRWNTDVFYTWFESKVIMDLDYNPLEAFILTQSGSNSLSVLSQLDYGHNDNWDFRLAYKFLRAQENFLEGLDYNYQIPLHRAFLNVAYSTASQWTVDGTINFFGPKRQPSTRLSPSEFQVDEWSPGFSTVNLQVNKTWKRFEFYVGSHNLLNFRQNQPIVNAENPQANYFDSNFVWGPIFGRNVYLGLYYKIP